jgi:uncharacterized protein DUF6011
MSMELLLILFFGLLMGAVHSVWRGLRRRKEDRQRQEREARLAREREARLAQELKDRQYREELEAAFAALKGSRKEIARRLAAGERFDSGIVPDLPPTDTVTITPELDREQIEPVPCDRCGRLLTDPESIARGMGPVCADKAACEAAMA